VDKTFKEWMDKVDQEIKGVTDLTSEDLPDYMFYDAYEDGVDPAETAAKCLDAAGYY